MINGKIKIIRYIENSVGAALLVYLILIVAPAGFISKGAFWHSWQTLSTSNIIVLTLVDTIILYFLTRLLIQFFQPKKPRMISEIDLSRGEAVFTKPSKSQFVKVSLQLFGGFAFRYITIRNQIGIQWTDICFKIGQQGAFPVKRVHGKTKKIPPEYESIFSNPIQHSRFLLESTCQNRAMTFSQDASTAKLEWTGARFSLMKRLVFSLLFMVASVIAGVLFWFEFESWLIRGPSMAFLSAVFIASLWAGIAPAQFFQLVLDKNKNEIVLNQLWLQNKSQVLFQGPLSKIGEWILDFRTTNDDEVYEIAMDLGAEKKNFNIPSLMNKLQSKINNKIYLPLLPQDELLLLDIYCRLKDFLECQFYNEEDKQK